MPNEGVSGVQFCTTGRPQLFEFEVPCCRTCSLRSKKANLEDGIYNFQKWGGPAQSWGPCMPIWHPLMLVLIVEFSPDGCKTYIKSIAAIKSMLKNKLNMFNHGITNVRQTEKFVFLSPTIEIFFSLRIRLSSGTCLTFYILLFFNFAFLRWKLNKKSQHKKEM